MTKIKLMIFSLALTSFMLLAGVIQSEEKKSVGNKKEESHVTANIPSKQDQSKDIDKKLKELKDKEEDIKKQESRLLSLKKDVDERIDKYSKILAKIEESLGKTEQLKNERLDYIVKVYEAMPPEDAANKIKVLDEQTAVKIFLRMKSKKSGAIMAQLPPEKVASLTEKITQSEKKIPTK